MVQILKSTSLGGFILFLSSAKSKKVQEKYKSSGGKAQKKSLFVIEQALVKYPILLGFMRLLDINQSISLTYLQSLFRVLPRHGTRL